MLLFFNGSKAPLNTSPGARAFCSFPSMLLWLIKMHEISSHSATATAPHSQPHRLVTLLFTEAQTAAESPAASGICPSSPLPSPLSCSVLLNLNCQPSSDRHSELEGEGGSAIYNSALFALRTRPFFPGHLPEPHSPGFI